MNTRAWVELWGRRIGAVALLDGEDVAAFEYHPEFLHSGIEVAPVTMPLARRIYQFPELGRQSFQGLPGLLADSLPDRFGNALINAWLARQGRQPGSFNAVERLCYIGQRGMGALEFSPALGPEAPASNAVEIDQLVELASEILSARSGFHVSFDDAGKEQALMQILRIGTSAGGARAKAVIAWNPKTNEVRSGQVSTEMGFEYWLLKFDGVSNNRDRELADPAGYGAIEYACALMARDCGIDMMPCRLFEEGPRRHFMTRRFDRTADGQKIHMQSLAALAHFDFNLAGAYSYEQALLTIRQLGLSMDAIEQMFRRMVFNIVIRNQDDHVKNIAFLMDKRGQWSLAPAFDMTYSFNPEGAWTSRHQMSMNDKRDDFTMEDFKKCAQTAGLKRGQEKVVVNEVLEVVSEWLDYAQKVGIAAENAEEIERNFRLRKFG